MYECMKMYVYTYFPCLLVSFVPCDMCIIGLCIICFLKFVYQIYINRHGISTVISFTSHGICGIFCLHGTRNVGCASFKICCFMVIHWIKYSSLLPTSSVRCWFHYTCLIKGVPYCFVCSDIGRAINSGRVMCARHVKHIKSSVDEITWVTEIHLGR
jgi:hypothetical protein